MSMFSQNTSKATRFSFLQSLTHELTGSINNQVYAAWQRHGIYCASAQATPRGSLKQIHQNSGNGCILPEDISQELFVNERAEFIGFQGP